MKTILLGTVFLLGQSLSEAKSFEVLNPKVEQGGTVIVRISPNWLEPAIALYVPALDKKYVPNKNGDVFIGVGIDVTTRPNKYVFQPGKYILYLINNDSGERRDLYYAEVEVLETNVIKKRTAAFTGMPKLRRDRQRRAVIDAFKKNQSVDDFTDSPSYIDPLDLARDVIAPFGFIYKNNPYLTHTGVDLRAPVGTPVRAVNDGRVVLAAKRFRREGNMIILNHGLGIFSVYMHLSKFSKLDVTEQSKRSKKKTRKRELVIGDMVERGQVIGLSGKTGAGADKDPHLHFNMRVWTYVDPLAFIDIMNQHIIH